ncbi:MAG: galactokinase [Fimbriimonadales bacterium]|nr:galactokinase [Fimbriimonadales bacterium]MDW8052348.1 galactokinase [Armatimonadota bacterium]
MLCVRAPGRVNLIGEHTDYNEGYVLPVAVNLEVRVHANPRSDSRCRVYSELLDEQCEFDLASLPTPEATPPTFARYVVGVAWALQQHTGRTLTGIEATISSTLPIGAGLSSSAAIEAAFAMLWNILDGLHLERMQLALLCQRAEQVYAGVQCGLMDQAVSLLSKAGHALFLDTRTLFTQSIPIPEEWAIVVADTGKPRALTDSEYNLRRAQCEQAVAALRPLLGEEVSTLRDVSPEQAALYLPLVSEPMRRRARHVIGENARVLEFLTALRHAEQAHIRALMLASHASLRDDYEVSCAELDAMVDACLAAGAIGARMTGAGFGGACVALVEKTRVAQFLAEAEQRYRTQTNYTPRFFVCEAVAGASVCN